jgi:phospholipid/cholesterol/gamma-HCH transport system substrate-binding protein
METRAHYVLIGAFMLGGIVLALLFTLWLGRIEREFDEYDVIFEDRVSGLQVGAAVQYGGIPVGEISELGLAPSDPGRVIARIRVQNGTPIKTDTRGELELVGVTGLAIIQLVGGSPGAPLLKAVSDQRVPEIEGEAGGIALAISSAGEIFANASRILDEDNAATISRILDDVEAVTDVFADNEGDIKQLVEDAAITMAVLRRNAEALDGTVVRVEEILAEVEKLAGEDTAEALASIRAASDNVNDLVQEVEAIVEENRPAIDAFAQQGLGAAVGVIAKAGRLVDTAEGVLLEIDRDPARFLLGEGRPTAE